MTTSQTKKATQAIHKTKMAHKALAEAIQVIEEFADENGDLVSWAIELAIASGMKKDGANVTNARRFIEARMMKESGVGLQELPEVFHTFPLLYTRGQGRISRDNPGFGALTLVQAQREHRQVVQLLLEAWPLADEEDRDAIEKSYLSQSPEEFKRQLYDFLYRADSGSSLEAQLLAEIDEQEKAYQYEEWSRKNERSGGMAAAVALAKKKRRK